MEFVENSKAAAHRAGAVAARLVKAAAKQQPLLWPVWQTLPVAGLDVPAAQSVLYALRRGLPEAEVDGVIKSWLHALQLSQVASDRLLHAVSITQRHLRFWQARLKAGSHSSFLLLGRGPSVFAAGVLARLGWRQQQQQPLQSNRSASDRIEERIIALQLLSSELAAAVAAVHKAADGLKLQAIRQQQQQQQQRAKPQELQQQVVAAIAACVQATAAALQQLQPAVAQLQDRDEAVRHLSMTAGQPLANNQQQQQQQQAATLQGVQQQLQDLGGLLHIQDKELSHMDSADAGAALAAASYLAAQLGPLVVVPPWAAMPSSLQRHWIKYTLAAGVCAYAGVFLYRNSRLSGSPNLDTWVASGVDAVEGAWSNHVVMPLVTVRDELFKTFRDRPSIVSTAEFEADKASLLRMLADFQRDHPHAAAALAAMATDTSNTTTTTTADASSSSSSTSSSSSSSSASTGLVLDAETDLLNIDAVNKGMQVVMQAYEADVKKPIRGLLQGELARTLLIQVQRLKLDTEAAMLELDQILRANELSISLVAAVPALIMSWTLLRGLWGLLLVRAPPDVRREATPCRLAMAELERALAALAALQTSPSTAADAAAAAAVVPAGKSSTVAAAQGMVLYKLFKVYREAQALYRLKDSNSRYSDWPHMSADLLSMVQPDQPPAAKLELHRRMLRTYCVLQP